MDQVLVIDGDWTLEVVDDPHGIVLRAPPERPKFLSPGERIRCDRRVKAAGETVTFYRVAGTEGWVFDVNRFLWTNLFGRRFQRHLQREVMVDRTSNS